MTNQNRQPKGLRTGGQFAPGSQAEQPGGLPLPPPPTEPDADDYQFAADDCLRMSGLGALYVTSYDADAGSLGFEGGIYTIDVDTEYLPDDLAAKVNSLIPDQGGSGELNFHSWGSPSRSGITHLWSTRLDDTEREAVLDRLYADDPDEYNEDMLRHWEDGDPQGLDSEFGFISTPKEWKYLGKVIAEVSPSARKRLEVAEALSNKVQEEWAAQCDYMGSDQWAVDQADLARI